MIRMAAVLAGSFVLIALADAADEPKDGPVALERKLLSQWHGGPCVGELTLRADGTFEREHYSPGNRTLSGTWVVRWDALPPTLALTCKTSDYEGYVGKTQEVKIVELNDEVLAYKNPDWKQPQRYTRVKK